MFRRPWQIWVTYFAILTLLVSGFAWLTVRVVELDARELQVRAEAEQEEKIRLALWRMESVAMPIIAAEAARPYLAYRPYFDAPGSDPASRVPSPLLRLPSDYVLLNFEIGPDGKVASPQCPPPQDQPWAISHGTSLDQLTMCCPRVDDLQSRMTLVDLLSQLPADAIPAVVPSMQDQVTKAIAGEAYVVSSNSISGLVAPPTKDAVQSPTQESSAKEFVNRSAKLQSYAQQEALQQRVEFDAARWQSPAREGISRPIWLEDRLLLARRVDLGGQQVVQGCWINWDRLRGELLAELADLLPNARLQIVAASETADPGRSLASIPLALIPPALVVDTAAWTPTRLALVTAWGSLLAAAITLAVLLHGVASLSERRAAFVSAVTHELRTPLTTLQLYSDMLSNGMISTEGQKQEYMQTLQRESGRLSHLIDNVLALSRLERRTARRQRESLTVAALLDRAGPRLRARAELSQRQLELTIAGDAQNARVCVEPTSVEQILLNLIDNGCKHGDGGTSPRLELTATVNGRGIDVRVRDYGPGLCESARRKLFRRFSKSDVEAARSAPGLGLGLALSRELARGEGGELQLESTGPEGTTFRLTLRCE